MKKNFLAVAAMMVVAFFVSTEIAKAADISFSGQIRSRWEVNEHTGNAGLAENNQGGNFNNNPDDFIFSSVRLAATANVNDTTSAFIQLQSVRNWGNTGSGSAATGAGDGNASNSANNRDATVGIHQAYFTLKNFANLPVPMDLKLGRQEIKLDGWRLFGNTIWTPGMQTHDAIRMNHKHDNMTLSLAYILAQEDGRSTDFQDSADQDVFLAYANMKGVLGGQFSATYVYNNNTGALGNGNDSFSTIGGRQAGQLFGLDYRGEFYYQWGRADATANANSASIANQQTRNAYMYGVRVGKTFKNVMFKPGVTLWYDYLSGTTDEDRRNGEWGSFNTLFDTGHKYYGLQDVFLGVGGGGTGGTRGLGLQDLAVKFKLNPMPGWTLKLDAHAFATAESAQANTTVAGFGSVHTQSSQVENGAYLGNEFDLTLVNKYNANTKIMIGFSNFNATNTFKSIKGTTTNGSADANWAYVQMDVKF
jgi:hypothetical protein